MIDLAVFDIETISNVDLKKVGAARYARDPSTDVLVVCYTNPFTKGKGPQRWLPGDPPPEGFLDVPAKGGLLAAFNVQFDMAIIRWVLAKRYGWPWPGHDAFYDLMADVRVQGLPGALEKCAPVLGVGQKNMVGNALMKKLCKPARPIKSDSNPRRLHTPEALEQVYKYCHDDVRVEHAISRVIPRLTKEEKAICDMDMRMNERGVAVDADLVHAIMDVTETIKEARRSELAEITDGAVTSESQQKNICAFITSRGYPIDSIAKDSINEYLDDPALSDPVSRRVLEIRQETGKTSLAKLDKMLDSMCDDGRVRGMMVYHGAHTGRWSSRIIQLQNIPQGSLSFEPDEGVNEYDLARKLILDRDIDTLRLCYGEDKIMDVCVSLIRACLWAPEGRELVVSDFSAIEGRVLAWLAHETHVLDAYREGRRMYCVAASDIFGIPYDELYAERKGRYKKQDKIGKTCELALGYQGWVGAMLAFGADKLGLSIPEIENIAGAWRDGRPRTRKFWYSMNDAALAACRCKRKAIKVGRITFYHSGQHLRMRLPSGRWLTYRNAHIRQKQSPHNPEKEIDAVFYWGVDSLTKRWCLMDTYGGKLVENATQAVARDLMALAMIRAEEKGLHPVLTVHDEVVLDEVEGRVSCDELNDIMTELPPWARGLPIAAESWSGSYYRK
jgi:DNA polymerase